MKDAFGVERVSKGIPKGMLRLNPAKMPDYRESAFIASRQRAHEMGRSVGKNPASADSRAWAGRESKYYSGESLSALLFRSGKSPTKGQKAVRDKRMDMMRRGKINASRAGRD